MTTPARPMAGRPLPVRRAGTRGGLSSPGACLDPPDPTAPGDTSRAAGDPYQLVVRN